MRRLAILVGSKGRGTNMAGIITACQAGRTPAEASLVISPKAQNPAILRAQALGVETAVLPVKSEGYPELLAGLLRSRRIDLVCLAGYMTLLPPAVVEEWRGRILNIHPALLPRHGGRGMYGIHVHEAVLAAGDRESGCTVHYVTERYDEGSPILQLRCPVLPGDTAETLAERVLDREAEAYPEAIRLVLERLDS